MVGCVVGHLGVPMFDHLVGIFVGVIVGSGVGFFAGSHYHFVGAFVVRLHLALV